MAAIVRYFESSVPFIAGRISDTVLNMLLTLTTQLELLALITAEVLIFLLMGRTLLQRFFDTTDYLNETVERVVMRFIDLTIIIVSFSMLSSLSRIANDLYGASLIRWQDMVQAFLIIFAFIFIVVEKLKAPPAPSLATGAKPKAA